MWRSAGEENSTRKDVHSDLARCSGTCIIIFWNQANGGCVVSVKPCAFQECNLKTGQTAAVGVTITMLLIQKKLILQIWKS